MDLGIDGRVAIVTGGSRGIGRATVQLLVEEGAAIVLGARDPDDVRLAVEELERSGGRAVGVPTDVAEPGSSRALVGAALERFGRIDIVVNNAGGGGRDDRLDDFDEEAWLHIYRLNVVSAVRLATAALPTMRERGWGRVVNVASTMARDADPRFAAYGAAKAALLHATKSLARRYSAEGVLTNCVLPGLTRSDGVLDGYRAAAEATERTEAQIEQRMLERQPIALGRTGEPREVANAIAFLCSEGASWITGDLLVVDGGTIRVVP